MNGKFSCKAETCRDCRFTLIELLIVISIIAVLAGMLLPALSSVKDKVTQMSCLSNMKQMTSASLGYTHDFNDWFPWPIAYAKDHEKVVGPAPWVNYFIENKILTFQTLCCPVYPDAWKKEPFTWKYTHFQTNKNLGVLGKNEAGQYLVSRIPTSRIKKPGELVAIHPVGDAPNWSKRYSPSPYERYIFRHNKHMSLPLGYLDGHALMATYPVQPVMTISLSEAVGKYLHSTLRSQYGRRTLEP